MWQIQDVAVTWLCLTGLISVRSHLLLESISQCTPEQQTSLQISSPAGCRMHRTIYVEAEQKNVQPMWGHHLQESGCTCFFNAWQQGLIEIGHLLILKNVHIFPIVNSCVSNAAMDAGPFLIPLFIDVQYWSGQICIRWKVIINTQYTIHFIARAVKGLWKRWRKVMGFWWCQRVCAVHWMRPWIGGMGSVKPIRKLRLGELGGWRPERHVGSSGIGISKESERAYEAIMALHTPVS